MVVDEATEYYLVHSIGLTKKQIENMLPSEIDQYCEDIIRKRINEREKYKPDGPEKIKYRPLG
jgi:hypothetical protein